nr:hypothetical protein Iba_chr10eCG13340 [Ipomoea batatas]
MVSEPRRVIYAAAVSGTGETSERPQPVTPADHSLVRTAPAINRLPSPADAEPTNTGGDSIGDPPTLSHNNGIDVHDSDFEQHSDSNNESIPHIDPSNDIEVHDSDSEQYSESNNESASSKSRAEQFKETRLIIHKHIEAKGQDTSANNPSLTNKESNDMQNTGARRANRYPRRGLTRRMNDQRKKRRCVLVGKYANGTARVKWFRLLRRGKKFLKKWRRSIPTRTSKMDGSGV